MADKSCNGCEFAFFVDYGYSNYTTEGTYFYCGVNKHPNGSFDRWYGEDRRLRYAKYCKSFVDGKAVEMDVECDRIHEPMSIAQRILWPTVNARPAPKAKSYVRVQRKFKWEVD